jgi:hypothetical protein
MKSCKECSTPCSEGDIFCSNCGANLKLQKDKSRSFNAGFIPLICCTTPLVFVTFTFIFDFLGNSMGIGFGGIYIGIFVSILAMLIIVSVYIGYIQKQLRWAGIAFIIYNIIVGIFVICIFDAIGMPLDIFGNPVNFFEFLALTFSFSILFIILIICAYPFAASRV